MAKTAPAASKNRNYTLLIGVLIFCGLFYVILMPWLRRMNAETARIEADAKKNEAQAADITRRKQQMEAMQNAAKTSSDPGTLLRAATVLGDEGKWDEALTNINAALKYKPGDTDTLLLLADINLRARRYYESRDAYRQILAKNPDNIRALTGLGWLYTSFAWTMEARKLLEPAVQKFPKEARLRVVLSMAYLQHNEFTKVEKQLLEVRSLDPENVAQWSPLVDAYNKKRDFPKAIQTAQEALAKMPEDGRLLNEMASAYFELGNYAKAEELSKQILAQAPDEIRAHYRLALCYQRTKRQAEAVKELEQIVQKNPEFAQTRLLLGQIYIQSGRAEEGKKLLDAYREHERQVQRYEQLGYLMTTKTDDAEAHYKMGQYYRDQRNAPRMIMEVKRALEIRPDYPEAKQLLAEAPAPPPAGGL